MPKYRIAVVGGDGIGPEVMAEALKVLRALAEPGRLQFAFEEVEAGAACYRRTGEDLPRETLDVCRAGDAILFGAAGLPDVRFPDGTELAPQLTLRVVLDLYIGLRPIKLYPGVPSPLRLPEGERIDYVILRENTEGLYASRGAGVRVGGHVVTDTLVVTRPGTARICRQAFELARRRAGAPRDGIRRVTVVDKSNVLKSYAFFREIFDEVASD
jgi:3-isopropylmalate dehydrogenase